MNTYYDNILIPVDQSLDTQKAVTKAIEFAKPWRTTVHLIHLIRSLSPLKLFRTHSPYKAMLDDNLDKYIKTLINLMHWKDLIESNGHGIAVRIHIKTGFSLQALVIQTIQKERGSLIILAHTPNRALLSLGNNISGSLIAQRTGCHTFSIETEVQAGCGKEVETLSKPIYNKPNLIRKRNFAGFSLTTLHNLLQHS